MSAPKNRADVVALMAETIIAMRDCEPVAVALAVLAQQEAAGLRVVPVEATGGMIAAATTAWPEMYRAMWSDMLSASPFAPDAEP